MSGGVKKRRNILALNELRHDIFPDISESDKDNFVAADSANQ